MKFSRIALALALAGISAGANATIGYFALGYGMKAAGMGGASTTNTEDAFFGANNPAAAAFVGNRIDVGASVLNPVREAVNTGANRNGSGASGMNWYPVPEIGYNKMITPDLALGVTVYGNGLGTDYAPAANGKNIFGGNGTLGMEFLQMVVAPTLAYKVSPGNSLGISPLLAFQRFRLEGLNNTFFTASPTASSNPLAMTNVGADNAAGYGVRLGYLGKLSPSMTIGAAYASRMKMTKFDRYRGLFAEQGGMDVPENYNIGVSWQVIPALRFAVDYQRINFGDIKSVGNPSAFSIAPGQKMGDAKGPGFGWENVGAWKLGIEYKYSDKLTLRTGWSENQNPISEAGPGAAPGEILFNIIAPAVIEKHATLGFTYTLASGNELTMAYTHAFANSLSQRRIYLSGAGRDTISMYENILGVQYSWKD